MQVNELTDRELGYLFSALDKEIDKCRGEITRLNDLDKVCLARNASRENARKRWTDRLAVYVSLTTKLENSYRADQ